MGRTIMQGPIKRDKPEFDMTWQEVIVATIILIAIEIMYLELL